MDTDRHAKQRGVELDKHIGVIEEYEKPDKEVETEENECG
jgi:hypothetical protein